MKALILFPHQLIPVGAEEPDLVVLLEAPLFFKQYHFHRHKLQFHRASMKAHEARLAAQGLAVKYIESRDSNAQIPSLLAWLEGEGYDELVVFDPVDDWLAAKVKKAVKSFKLRLEWRESPLFILEQHQLKQRLGEPKNAHLHHADFYRKQRLELGLLLDENNKPEGGKWSFDSDNRKSYPKGKMPPVLPEVASDEHWQRATEYVRENFPNAVGAFSETPLVPYTRMGALRWLIQFFQERFAEFGAYEDAIVADELSLNHSVISPLLNVGLLQPVEVVEAAIRWNDRSGADIPINAVEGFVRQIVGWREFVRGIYSLHGRTQRTTNYFGFSRKIPAAFYEGTTGIEPVDQSIQKLLKYGYLHHIERLMILGNIMLLCEFDPDEVYRWFMELFIDAYDWVMVPNVYGMSQFSDGGLLATKPYISGSNYVLKMSDYKKGDWCSIWDGLFWRFLAVHREVFEQNPRMSMLVKNWERMSDEKKEQHLQAADSFLESL